MSARFGPNLILTVPETDLTQGLLDRPRWYRECLADAFDIGLDGVRASVLSSLLVGLANGGLIAQRPDRRYAVTPLGRIALELARRKGRKPPPAAPKWVDREGDVDPSQY